MRFLPALLFVALTGSAALADDASTEAKPADAKQEATTPAAKKKVPFRVVRMLPETRQVLLFDKTKGTHVVAEVGQDVDGYLVDDIDDDEVTLVAPTGAEVILTAPDMSWRRRQAEKKAAEAKASKTAATDPAPEDPYADPADAAATPAAPAAAPTTAPIVPGADGVRVANASGATVSPDEPAPADPYGGDPAVAAFFEAVGASSPAPASPSPATTPTPAASKPTTSTSDGAVLGAALTGSPAPVSGPSTSPSATTTAAAGPTTATIKRADIDGALGNFAGTASTFKATFTAQGLRFDDVVAGSLLARVGLQKGDTITTVDGQPLKSLDDAANLYARLPTARGSTIQVVRAGKPVTLRIAIQ